MPDQVYAVRTSEDFAAQSEAAFDWLEQKADFDTAGDKRLAAAENAQALVRLA